MFLIDYLHFGHFVLLLFIAQSFVLLRFKRQLLERDNLLENLRKEVEALLLCERGIADRIKHQQTQMRGITNRQDNLEITETSQVNYKQAIALMHKGASTDELVVACDISRGEVELISHMQKLKRSISKKQAA